MRVLVAVFAAILTALWLHTHGFEPPLVVAGVLAAFVVTFGASMLLKAAWKLFVLLSVLFFVLWVLGRFAGA